MPTLVEQVVALDRPGPVAEVRRWRPAVSAAADLTTAAQDGARSISVGVPLPLARAAEAHDRVDNHSRQRVLLAGDD